MVRKLVIILVGLAVVAIAVGGGALLVVNMGHPSVKIPGASTSAPSATATGLGDGKKKLPDDVCAYLNTASALVRSVGEERGKPLAQNDVAFALCTFTGTKGNVTLLVSNTPKFGEDRRSAQCKPVDLPAGKTACTISHPLQGDLHGPGAGIVFKSSQHGAVLFINGITPSPAELETAAAAIAQRLT